MLALSIYQPYAELILQGIKTVEYRSRATRIIGEGLYIYATKA
jgi:predicted transcriptional regulator